MRLPDSLPSPFPLPPFPLVKLPRIEKGEEREPKNPEEEFVRRMKEEGYQEDLIEMGLKVAKNHMRPPEEAFRIGRNYIKEMSK